ncbi:F-box protein At3g12350-like [Rosa rugosa]|uniref:F-box protein At3g12350-like n=1 Tax=Rosa rugosa TaxID=74645 RepID=UPI002B40EF4D|nr:F-box protein At3g12350-like [Rosa rugosa]
MNKARSYWFSQKATKEISSVDDDIKGIYDDMNLGFYLVAYDDIGGISYQKACDLASHICSFTRVISKHPIFWSTGPTFSESSFVPKEESLYNSRIHIRQNAVADHIHQLTRIEVVSRIL